MYQYRQRTKVPHGAVRTGNNRRVVLDRAESVATPGLSLERTASVWEPIDLVIARISRNAQAFSGLLSILASSLTAKPSDVLQMEEEGKVRIAIASDQAGYEAKQRLAVRLTAAGHQVTDASPSVSSRERADYAEQLALSVLRHDAERGIIVTSRAVGASVAANRVPGIRAASCNDPHSARVGAHTEGMNVLVLALHALEEKRSQEVIDAYLAATLASGRSRGRIAALAFATRVCLYSRKPCQRRFRYRTRQERGHEPVLLLQAV